MQECSPCPVSVGPAFLLWQFRCCSSGYGCLCHTAVSARGFGKPNPFVTCLHLPQPFQEHPRSNVQQSCRWSRARHTLPFPQGGTALPHCPSFQGLALTALATVFYKDSFGLGSGSQVFGHRSATCNHLCVGDDTMAVLAENVFCWQNSGSERCALGGAPDHEQNIPAFLLHCTATTQRLQGNAVLRSKPEERWSGRHQPEYSQGSGWVCPSWSWATPAHGWFYSQTSPAKKITLLGPGRAVSPSNNIPYNQMMH